MANHTDQAALHFDTHSARALDRSTAVTIRAVSVDSTGVALRVTLPCHLHNTERGNGKDVVLCFISSHLTLHTREYGVAILLCLHVYEVEDDETTDVTQAHLSANLSSRLKIHL